MSNLLRMALATEDYEASPNPNEEAAIVMKGPLSDAYTKALNLVYANDAPNPGAPAPGEATPNAPETPVPEVDEAKSTLGLESLVNDSLVLRGMMARMAFEPHEQEKPKQTVYAVRQCDVTPQVVKEVINDLADRRDRDGDYILIIDATQPGPNSPNVSAPTDRAKMLSASLENMVVTMGGVHYQSFGQYAKNVRHVNRHNRHADRTMDDPDILDHAMDKVDKTLGTNFGTGNIDD